MGNIQRVDGQAGTLTEGMFFSYTYQQAADYAPDVITANGGQLLFADQSGKGRAVCYDGGNKYRIICATFVFGALKDGGGHNTKSELMRKYVDYLLAGSPVEDGGIEGKVPSGFVLYQNFPNPFNACTTIRFALPESGHMRLSIYNALGQLQTVLVEGYFQAGWHAVTWNASRVASGIYIAGLEASGEIRQIKMCVVK